MLEVLKQALEALEDATKHIFLGDKNGVEANIRAHKQCESLRQAIREHAMYEVQRLGQEIEQEPVAWLLTDKNINSLQVDSIQRLINRLKHAHYTDLCVRINGQDEWFQADWLKHMVRAIPPQRTEQEPVAFLANAMRFKLSFDSEGKVNCFWNQKELDGRWVALVAAEDDCHLKVTHPPQRTEQLKARVYCGQLVGKENT